MFLSNTSRKSNDTLFRAHHSEIKCLAPIRRVESGKVLLPLVRAVDDHLPQQLARFQVERVQQGPVPNIHLALVHDRLGDADQALAALREALSLAEPGGFIRSFVDAGPQLEELLLQIKRPGVNPHYLAEILAAFDVTPPGDVLDAGPAIHLTRRE